MNCKKCGAELPPDAVYCHKCGKKQTGSDRRKPAKRPNGTGSVYKLKDTRRSKPWAAARSGVLLGTFATKAEAVTALEQTAGREVTSKYNLTFRQVYEEWKEEHFRDITDSGRASYKRAFAVFEDLHDKKFRLLRTADFQRIIDRHWDKKHSTVSKYKQLLTQMSRYAVREEIITTDFAHYVKVPEAVKTEKAPFTEAEIAAITAVAGDTGDKDHETAKIILMLLSTGMRLGELFSLTAADCKPEGEEIPVYVVGGEKTAAGRDRVIPIRPEGREAFGYFLARRVNESLLSGYQGNRRRNDFRARNYYPFLDRLGISREKTPHTTRHTYTSWAVAAGMSPTDLQRILGHADFTTTANIYTHKTPESLVEAVETAEAAAKQNREKQTATNSGADDDKD